MFPQIIRIGWGKKAYMDNLGFEIEVTQQISKTTYEKVSNNSMMVHTFPKGLRIHSSRAITSRANNAKELYYIVIRTATSGINGGRFEMNNIANDIKGQITIFNKINK